jgi:hypothetical protein
MRKVSMKLNTAVGQSAKLLNEYGAADLLTLSVATMRRWRLLRQGPKWIKLGSAVRYRPEDIEAYINGRAA